MCIALGPSCCCSCSKQELAQLFTLRVDTRCDTAQILREAAGKARAAAAAAGNTAAAANALKQQRRQRRQQVVDEDDEDDGFCTGGVAADEDPAAAAAAAAAAEFMVGRAGGAGQGMRCWRGHRDQARTALFFCCGTCSVKGTVFMRGSM